MRAIAIILLLVGLGSAGLGIMHYVQYTNLREKALSRLDKARQLYDQAASKQSAIEAGKLMEEADESRRDSNLLLDSAEQPKGYATLEWVICGAAILLSVVFFILSVGRRRRALDSAEAHLAA